MDKRINITKWTDNGKLGEETSLVWKHFQQIIKACFKGDSDFLARKGVKVHVVQTFFVVNYVLTLSYKTSVICAMLVSIEKC